MTLVSDGAFTLYVHLCLNANRRTGCLSATVDQLARAMARAPTAVASSLNELQACAVCRVIRSDDARLVLEIHDCFWPYQKQQTAGCAPEPETEFVQEVRDLFLAPACVQASFSAADEMIAKGLYRRGVSMQQIMRAILLGCARKYVSMLNAGARAPITSLEYFADVIDEVIRSPIPESYWEPLRAKVTRMERQWLQGHAVKQ